MNERESELKEQVDELKSKNEDMEWQVESLKGELYELRDRDLDDVLPEHFDTEDAAYLITVLTKARDTEPMPFRQKTLDRLIDALEGC